jgi:ribosomal protein L15
MAGQTTQDSIGSGEQRDEGATGQFGNAGVGAASALEQMKTQHERRHRRLLGRIGSPELDDERRPE